MQLDIALCSMHHALPRGCSHADAISQAGHLLLPIPAKHTCRNTIQQRWHHMRPVTAQTLLYPVIAQHICHLLVLHLPHDTYGLMTQHHHCVSGRMCVGVAAYDSANSVFVLLNPFLRGCNGRKANLHSHSKDYSLALLDLLEVDHAHCVNSS